MRRPATDSIRGERLDQGLAELAIDLSGAQKDRLLRLVALLARWNSRFNLTAVRDPLDMIGRHLLDSLAVLPYLDGPRALDLGCGPGFPGLPLAIASATTDFTLLDSNGKKTRFAQQAVIELSLKNVRVVRARIQEYRVTQGFDTITARAFASLSDILALARPLLRRDGRLLALKGQRPDQELQASEIAASRTRVIRLRVPQVEKERHLVIVRPQD